jgi:hypothetical protein
MEMNYMERYGKRTGETGLDANRPEKRQKVEDYRRNAGLIPDATQTPQEISETPRTFQTAWAVDQARSKLDQYNNRVEDAINSYNQLYTHVHARNYSEYIRVINKMEIDRDGNRYIDNILKSMDTQSTKSGNGAFSSIEAMHLVKQQVESDMTEDIVSLKKARDLFNALASAIGKRNIQDFKQIEKQLTSEKDTNKYINEGINIYREANKKADEDAKKYQQEKAEDEMDID